MDCYKIDKIDKIFIAFCSIIVTFYCVLTTFAFCDEDREDIDIQVVRGITCLNNTNGTFTQNNNDGVAYFELEDGYTYYLVYPDTQGINRKLIGCDTIPSLGGSFDSLGSLVPGTTYTFSRAIYNYLVVGYQGQATNFELYRVKNVGMTGAIDGLVQNVSVSLFWDNFQTLVPYIAVVVLGSFGFYWIFHTIKEVSNGKEKMF